VTSSLAWYGDNNMLSKTTNLIINLDHDDWILNDESDILAVVGFGTLIPLRPFAVNHCIRE
jgi:hypothetical protein